NENNWFDITPEYRPKGRNWHSVAQLNDSTFILFSGNAICTLSSYQDNDTWLLHFKKNQTEVDENENIVQNINFKDTKEEVTLDGLIINSEVQIYNLLGILQNAFKVSGNILKLNKSDFEKGIYFIKANSNGNFTNYKFVGQK
ncbi:MAG: T9SS type A sorting domain-containing protein, partial [Candidatus Kapabacteria bacterium]|nr:T9SS type A sorting domain-containing protein [Candidatus Kapabacteria bacterium]